MTGPKKFSQRLSGIAYNSISVCCYGRAFAKDCVIGSGWCLISWNSKGIPQKNASIMESLSENLDKKLYFQRTVEIKQPHALTGAKKFPQRLSGIAYNSISVCCYGRAFAKGCVIGSGWCLISWNSKGIPQKMPQSWSPSAKILIKPVFSAYCRDKTTTCPDRALPKTAYVFTASRYAAPHSSAFFQWLCHKKWLTLFSLEFQRNNRENALATGSTKGKTGEKGRIFTILRRQNRGMFSGMLML